MLIKDELNQTFKTTLGTDEVIIGGKDPLKFEPHVEFSKWNKENSLTIKPSLELALELGNSPTLADGKVQVSGSKIGFYFNPNPDNAEQFKFGLILNEKPDDKYLVTIDGKKYYQWTFQLEGWEDFDFFYQDTLENDWKKYDGGKYKTLDKYLKTHFRSEEVVGSYAIYHKIKKNHIIGQTNYGIGKAYHDYRPRFISATGDTQWAILNYKDGVRTVSLLKEWADKQVYPIKANDTFGNTVIAASEQGWDDGGFMGFSATSGAAGTASSIKIFTYLQASGDHIRMALYSDNSGVPLNRIANSDSGSLTITQDHAPTTDGEGTSASITASISASTIYWLCFIRDTYSFVMYDTTAVVNCYASGQVYANFPTATAPTTYDPGNYRWSYYATYTAGGGGAVGVDIHQLIMVC